MLNKILNWFVNLFIGGNITKITGFETNRSNLEILFGHKHDLEKEQLERK